MPPPPAPAAADPTLRNLSRIDHIVVLMLENRSFDHMLGYLKLEAGLPVDGLERSMSNRHAGKTYRVHHLTSTKLTKEQDPGHGGADVREQLASGNGGFVSNYAKHNPKDPNPGTVMGYYNGTDLPVYDRLVREYAVCDRWFCSVPGATWPNRLYSVCGKAAGSKDNKRQPLYAVPSFVRHLDRAKVSWRWYAHEYVATLRMIDDKYRLSLSTTNFRYFDRRTAALGRSFLEHAAAGQLASVSWIDPNFVDFNLFGPAGSNDDHPPSDVKAGQKLALSLYTALASSPKWSKTLLVITYDEHGGFFDHVGPPAAKDDSPAFRSYGPRVPALVISPWIPRGIVSSELYDHTSIIKTILLRFCRRADGSIPAMGARVANANHLGGLLTLRSARPKPSPASLEPLIKLTSQWHGDDFADKLLTQAAGDPPREVELNELQEGYLKAKDKVRREGVPAGMP
ncbi:MAG TPA: alkaline phosphatase family protein [Gaiellaceae bacterium]|jgi:phospholipase C|nr:alkaline phosphatase family protein [Gaiellaceae bacterium]